MTFENNCVIIKRSLCECSSMVEFQPSKLAAWVRFPSLAPKNKRRAFYGLFLIRLNMWESNPRVRSCRTQTATSCSRSLQNLPLATFLNGLSCRTQTATSCSRSLPKNNTLCCFLNGLAPNHQTTEPQLLWFFYANYKISVILRELINSYLFF